ncbi:MAG: hypothetical protein ACYDH3_12435, partial [Candidatus Aminicenantales bacterium]
MAEQFSADSGLMNVAKSYYNKDKTISLLIGNSKYLRKIPKERFVGKEYRDTLPFMHSVGVAGDATIAKALGYGTGLTPSIYERIMPPGKIVAYSNIGVNEILASQNEGGYEPLLAARLWHATEALRRLMSSALYGSGFGEVGKVISGTNATSGSFTATNEAAANLQIGMEFQVTAGTTKMPDEAYQSGGPFTVTGITPAATASGQATITFTPNAGAV